MKPPPKKPLHATQPPSPRSTDWSEVADWYDQLVGDEGSEYQREVIIPGVLRLLDIKKGHTDKPLTILDLACGQGVLCRKLASTGCTVAGLDAAEPLIAAARRRNQTDKLPIHYEVADVTRLLDENGKLPKGLEPASFDAITLILAIQNLTPLSPVWRACRELLKPGGKLIIVMMHPCFRIPRQSDWIWQPQIAGGTQSRVVRQYLTSETILIQTHPGLAVHGKDAKATTHFHRPLQAYTNTLGNAGLLIEHLEEWPSHKISERGPKKAALDRARQEIPLFLALRSRRV